MSLKRREARELAFTLIYEMTFYTECSALTVLEKEKELRPFAEDRYLRQVVTGVGEKKEELDALIEKYAEGWTVKRISRISLAIMRLCLYEMLFVEGIPFNVSINEAVELCKKFNDEKSVAFVNGVLNAAAEHEGLKKKT
ncbi:MAG: transcription antitermination factor NusB [Clostridia bacterium]|nr:transcription antitermination factor NusB [Clostridia bacterium]